MVPEAVQLQDLHTLPPTLLERIALLSSPRFAEYWEWDPCTARANPPPAASFPRSVTPSGSPVTSGGARAVDGSERSEAGSPQTFAPAAGLEGSIYSEAMVGPLAELELWLVRHDQQLPKGAKSELERYAANGQRFGALLVDVNQLPEDPSAIVLPPFGFSTPQRWRQVMARIGLASVAAQHDLYLHLFADTRLTISGYPVRPGPTNLMVDLIVRKYTGEFYGALYGRLQERFPGAFVEEYAWPARGCADPCPGEPLSISDLTRLQGRRPTGEVDHWVHSRVHHRYTAKGLPRDIGLEPGETLSGGQGEPQGALAGLEPTRLNTSANAFAMRFVHAHRFRRDIPCPHPTRFQWGDPPRRPPGTAPVFIAKFTGVLSSQHIDVEQAVFSPVVELGLPGGAQPLLPRTNADPDVSSGRDDGVLDKLAPSCACSQHPMATPHAWGLALMLLLGRARHRRRTI